MKLPCNALQKALYLCFCLRIHSHNIFSTRGSGVEKGIVSVSINPISTGGGGGGVFSTQNQLNASELENDKSHSLETW